MSLVLGRKWGETVVIEHAGERLTIWLKPGPTQNDGVKNTRIVFDGPPSFHVRRGELPELDRAAG